MSDALSDLARDNRRYVLYRQHLKVLVSYLENPSDPLYEQLRKSVKEMDSVKRGYFGGQTNVSRSLDDVLSKLQSKDEETWKNLFEILNTNFIPCKKLMEISPLNQKI